MNQSESYFLCPECKKMSLLQIVHDILIKTKNKRTVVCPECKKQFEVSVYLDRVDR